MSRGVTVRRDATKHTVAIIMIWNRAWAEFFPSTFQLGSERMYMYRKKKSRLCQKCDATEIYIQLVARRVVVYDAISFLFSLVMVARIW